MTMTMTLFTLAEKTDLASHRRAFGILTVDQLLAQAVAFEKLADECANVPEAANSYRSRAARWMYIATLVERCA